MFLFLRILTLVHSISGLQSDQHISWLACKFIDEHVFMNAENHREVEFQPRDAVLQFGQAGDVPVNPYIITFMVTASKVDLRSYMAGTRPDDLECEIRRYRTEGILVRWPTQGAQEYDRWFTCNFKHTKGLFAITGFLRHAPAQPPLGTEDYNSVPAIGDREMITTSATMVLYTRTPMLLAGLQSDQKLHCQVALDHKSPKLSVEWRGNLHGEVKELFRYISHRGAEKWSGVSQKGLAVGDVSYSLPIIKISNEGKYMCSVSVPPLQASQDIALHVIESPKVTLNVGPELSLEKGAEQKVECKAEGYYPLDVEMEWYQEDSGWASGQRVGAPLPKKLNNVLFSSHKHHRDRTFSLSAFFYFEASLRASGSRFTCRVMHKSLRVPIRKSFTVLVNEPTRWMFIVSMVFVVVILLVVLGLMLHYLHSARRESMKSKPY